jgi:hypothetical protein
MQRRLVAHPLVGPLVGRDRNVGTSERLREAGGDDVLAMLMMWEKTMVGAV